METKGKKDFNIEEAYKNFVVNTQKYHKEQSAQIAPGNMYEEYCVRKELLFLMEELCCGFIYNSHCLFGIFNNWINNSDVDKKMKEDHINFIFNLLENFAFLVSYKTEIFKWRAEMDEKNKTLREMEIYELKAEDILMDKRLQKRMNKKVRVR